MWNTQREKTNKQNMHTLGIYLHITHFIKISACD